MNNLWKIFTDNSSLFLNGAWVTLYISLIGTILGLIIGLILGVVRTIPQPDKGIKRFILKTSNFISTIYIESFVELP
ncbi:hypothetical protein LZ578_07005 [Jeotgalibaca sp. MA1X17-3]|nr:hypothetical protein [Jeotgalibaca sp. MA1X17-3]UJF14771.1 hypothetical protein LZ578_07005 [Jeotgalibaca sp. MA1X17-3]